MAGAPNALRTAETGGQQALNTSLRLKFPSWGWSVASGLVSVALGVMLAMQWPASSTWFIGFAVGLDLFLYGWALLMFAAAVRKLTPSFA